MTQHGFGATTGLSACGCCAGLSAATPVEVFNRPGLSAVQYRSSTHALLKSTMLARLSTSQHPALQPLRARSDDDFAIALLDSWAVVLDILTFYQERIANESYLRTATERRSLLEQSRLIGYEPRPGVAASTYLAFTVDDPAPPPTPGLAVRATATVPSEVIIEKGAKVQSIPGPDEQAQMFETIEPIVAHFSWNAITPRLTQPHPLNKDLESVTIPGLSSFVKPGDALLVVAGDALEDRSVKRVLKTGTDLKRQVTQCDLVPAPKPVPLPPSKTIPGTFIKGFPILDNQLVTSELVVGTSWNQNVLLGMATTFKWSPVALEATINVPPPKPLPPTQGVFAFRERAGLFGHNAPKWDSLPASQRYGEKVTDKDDSVQTVEPVYPPPSWEGRTLSQEQANGYPPYVYLDRLYSSIVNGSWIVLESPVARDSYQVLETAELSRADFTLSGKITRLTLDRSDQFDKFTLRETTVYAAGEALELAPIPIVDVIQGSSVILSGAYLGLQVGRTVVVAGERDDLRGVTVSEAMTLADVTLDEGFTTLTFEMGLLYPYVRSTVTLNANVAQATHGETKSEVLGGGDASQAFQRLTLHQPPLTYTSAPTPSGGVSTLEVRVNDQLYQEVPTLYGHGPTERIYITRNDDDGKTTVQFGDGKTGARLPTGQNNILAAYRQGIGSGGLVRAGQLGLLMTRPLGVREVTNPLDATGAADPESRDDIRQNAALTLRTLDRIVSLQDYEDFARAFSGITKALATWTWNGQQQGVLITVAGPDGAVAEGTMLYDNLVNAIRTFGDPFIPLGVASYRPAFFKVAAKIKIAFGYTQEIVLQAVQDRLRNAFSFAARNFGQPVVLSEVIAEMQDVAGIDALTVTQLYRLDDDPTAPLPAQLVADPPRTAAAQANLGAELLTLDPAPLADIGVMS